MARESLLKQSWREARDTTSRFVAGNQWFSVVAAALLLATIGFVIGQTRGGRDTPATNLRADQQALSTSTTAVGFTEPTFPVTAPTIPPPYGPTIPGLGFISPRPTTRSSTTATTTRSATTTTSGSTATTSASGSGATTTTATTTPPFVIAPSAFNLNRIAYVASGGTWSVNPDGSDAQPITANAFTPAWSPNHTTIAFSNTDKPGGSLFTISSSGTRTQLTPAGTRDISPTWSPDGTQLAFARDANSIWVMNRNGSNAHQITTSSCINYDPTWSSDGTHIAFWSSRDQCGSGSFELYVMNSDGTNVRKLGTAKNSGAPAFSPDGATIAYASDQNGGPSGTEIYTIKLDGTDAKRLTVSPGEDTDPAWSPDGKRIAFRSDRGGIYTMKADGTDERFVVSGAQPSWS